MPPKVTPAVAVADAAPGDEAMMDIATEVLRNTFKLKEFKPMQADVIRRLLVDNESAALILPTGGGKSLTYQLPGVVFEGLTIVVSPLLALTKDQVDSLRRKGIRAAALDSSLSLSEAATVRDQIRSNALDILYVTPERLNNASFISLLSSCKSTTPIDLFAVDEAHCVSEWGHSFRPDYLKVARFVREVGAKRVLALTATATEKVVQDICVQFDIDYEKGAFRSCSYRENLCLGAVTTPGSVSKRRELNRLLSGGSGKRGGGSGVGDTIVYTTTQEDAEQVAREMREDGHDAKHYHAGMRTDERKAVQDWFMPRDGDGDGPTDLDDSDKENGNKGGTKGGFEKRSKVVVATIAFGMGIDKPNIRNVVHYKLPKTLEGYTQEIGRAGRDGLPSTCTLFLSSQDTPLLEGFIRGDTPTLPALNKFLSIVFGEKADGKQIGEEIELSLYTTARECDIKDGVMKLVFTYLELDHGLLKATTPRYKTYQMQFQGTGKAAIKRDKTTIGKEIVAAMREGPTWTTVEADSISSPYSHLLSKLSEWENNGYIHLKSSNVSNVFIIAAPPPDGKTRKQLASNLYERLSQKEVDDLERLKGVIAYGTGKGCLAVHLAGYFGDKLPGDKVGGICGNCSFCKTGKAAKTIKSTVGGVTVEGDEEKEGGDGKGKKKEDIKQLIKPVLSACGVRDDAMLLARLAFGISSPRISTLKLGGKDSTVFGSLDHCDFEELLGAFKEECEKAGGVNVDGWDNIVVVKEKKTSTTATTTGSYKKYGSSSGGGSWGAGSKRTYSTGGGGSYGSYGGRGGSKFARKKY